MTQRTRTLSARRSDRQHGFTLLELMISIALVLVLMLAISKIFSIASDTVGASQGIASAVRDARAAQGVLVRDFGSMAASSPFVIIRSEIQPGFRNRADMESDLDYDPTQNAASQPDKIRSIDLSGSGTEQDYGKLLLNVRNHRLDTVSFFASDVYSRTTANDSNVTPRPLVADMNCPEAWITYGHVVMPDNGAAYQSGGAQLSPGSFTGIINPNNFFANQWTLGRFAMLLKEKWDTDNDATTADTLIDKGGAVQDFYDVNPTSTAPNLQPLDQLTTEKQLHLSEQWGSPGTYNAAAAFNLVRNYGSRFDLAATSISAYKARLSDYIAANAGASWWDNFTLMRFEANPFVYKPISPAGAAKQSPLFLSSCSQFVVEFAGDFVTQNDAGAVTAVAPDNTVDYFVDSLGVRQIRWYGFPRDTDGDGYIVANSGDVVPVGAIAGAAQAFERVFPTAAIGSPTGDYNFPTQAVAGHKDKYNNNAAITTLGTTVNAVPEYVVAWGPNDTNRPKMYRITVAIDRPEMAGRSSDGQTFEYIISVP